MSTPAIIAILVVLTVIGGYLAERYPLRVTFKVRRTSGRSPGEVKSYLEGRWWYHEWKECLEATRTNDDKDVEAFLDGEFLENSLTAAFDWADTPQGYDTWYDRYMEFLDWYLDEEDEKGS